MRSYVKPNLEYVVLSVEEKFAVGSGPGCPTWGKCPSGTSSFVAVDGNTYIVNNNPSF
ncbi:MAG: hypothetical protein ABFC94_08405 [Syntrophomonas sp.]